MNRESIRKQLRRPGSLVVRTSDGKEFPVPHPEFVLVGRVNVAIEDEAGAFDVIDPLHIVSVRPTARHKQRKNGH
jgi:hypothetical protein